MAESLDLNYHHLRYFWLAAREGGVSAAAVAAGVGQPVVSGQIRLLEKRLKVRLFERSGRGVTLTEAGRTVFQYADDIFRLGGELAAGVGGGGGPARLPRVAIGVAEAVPKLVVYKLLEAVYELPDPVHLVCVEDRQEKLLADLAAHTLDLLITDAPANNPRVKAYTHPLGECGVTVFAAAPLAARLRTGFPRSLDGVQFLLPTPEAALRRTLDQWFAEVGVRPDVRGEFADSALLKVFGQAGRGAFALPSVVVSDVTGRYGVEAVGECGKIRVRFYAITGERKITHPAVAAVRDAARNELFA